MRASSGTQSRTGRARTEEETAFSPTRLSPRFARAKPLTMASRYLKIIIGLLVPAEMSLLDTRIIQKVCHQVHDKLLTLLVTKTTQKCIHLDRSNMERTCGTKFVKKLAWSNSKNLSFWYPVAPGIAIIACCASRICSTIPFFFVHEASMYACFSALTCRSMSILQLV